MKWYDFAPVARFTDTRGVIRDIRPLPANQLNQFRDLLDEIRDRLAELDPDQSWQTFYMKDKLLRHLIDSALIKCKITPKWISLELIHFLLFSRWDDELSINLPGLLIEINTPKNSSDSGCEMSTPESIALLSLATQSITEAFDLYNNVPAELLTDILESRSSMVERIEKGSPPISPMAAHPPMSAKELNDLIGTLHG